MWIFGVFVLAQKKNVLRSISIYVERFRCQSLLYSTRQTFEEREEKGFDPY